MLAVAQPLAAAMTTPAAAPPVNSIVIASAPSGDLLGYRIIIMPDGSAASEDGAGKGQSNLQPAVLKTFVTDLEAAMPLTQLPGGPCKPAAQSSAVTPAQTTAANPNPVTISYRAQTTPDLSCARDAREAALFGDVQTIAHSMYVTNYRSRHFTFHGNGAAPASIPAATAPPAPSMPSGGYGGGGYM